MSISMLFDFAALLLIVAGVIAWQVVDGAMSGAVMVAAAVLLIVVFAGAVILFAVLPAVARRWHAPGGTWVGKVAAFVRRLAEAFETTRRARVFGITMAYSLAVRVCKYAAFYVLFLAIGGPSFPALAQAEPVKVILSLLSSEAAAAVPLPTFMSFGAYEAGGTAAWVALGAPAAQAAVLVLALHIWSQLVDYACGGIGLGLLVVMGWGAGKSAWTPRRRAALAAAVLLALAAAAAGSFLAVRYFRAKEGAAAAPPSGDALPASRVHEQPARELLAGVRGFVVWSSNRAGNHDIWRMELSDLRLTRLTQHPNTEYYPRISPDGTRIAFCRGHREWVSQRSQADWDVWVMDSDGRNARRVAERANSPSWAGPDRLVFQQDATRVVELDLATGGSRVLAEAGKGGLREDTALTTPDFAPARSNLAVTLRGAMRMTATIPTGGEVHRVAGGCQLYWSPGAEFLYYVDAGRMRNGFWKIDPETGARTEWFDAEGDYGHEYFPRLSADGRWLVYGASAGGHEHDTADYELFIWRTTDSAARAARLTWHTGNDCWPDIFIPAGL